MCPRPGPTWSHHICNASAQASLVSCDPNRSINAPLATIRMPIGTSFAFAGGSWSQPLVTLPSLSVRVFPPTSVIAQGHLRLRVHRDLQGLGIFTHLFLHLFHVGKDRVGLLGLLQRLAFLNPLEAVVHPIEDVPQGALTGQRLFGMALVDQGVT